MKFAVVPAIVVSVDPILTTDTVTDFGFIVAYIVLPVDA
jgi:nitrate reductase NapE component